MTSNFNGLDIELYPNYFQVGVKDYISKKVFYFEVDEVKDQRFELYNFLTSYKGYLITFNGVHYDNVVLAYFVKEFKRLCKLFPIDLVRELKRFSNSVIDDDHEKIKWYKWYKHPWINIDLYLYWARSLRISKKISLKSLGIQLNHNRVQELPYPHDSILTTEQKAHVLDYNLNNDLIILDTLTKRMEEDIKLRKYINEEYGIQCWSMDAPKICSEYMLEVYCRKTYTGQQPTYTEYKREVKNRRYIPPIGWKLGDYLPHVEFKTKFFRDLFEEIKASGSEFSKEFLYQNRNTNVHVSMGIGGIHIINDNELYESSKTHKIIDQDVTSLYPTLLENHHFIRPELIIVLEEYLKLKMDRVEAKRSGNKVKDTFLKLCLNGFTGIVDQDVSWLYSPEHMTALRVFGQLIQLRVLEELSEVGIQVISNNTDGTTAIVPIEMMDVYHKINIGISKEFNIGWEYCGIDKIVYSNVNNYIAFISKEYMVDDDGNEVGVKEKPKIKKKGWVYKYGADIPLGDSVNEQVIPKALELFWKDGIPVSESISNPDKYGFHIYDYCRSNRISKDFEVFYNGEKVQNLNRYYFQKTGAYLLKRRKDKALYTEKDRPMLERQFLDAQAANGAAYAPDFKPYTKEQLKKLVDAKIASGNFEHVNKGEGVCLFNDYVEKSFDEYDIDYTHYIGKAYTQLTQILNRQLTLF